VAEHAWEPEHFAEQRFGTLEGVRLALLDETGTVIRPPEHRRPPVFRQQPLRDAAFKASLALTAAVTFGIAAWALSDRVESSVTVALAGGSALGIGSLLLILFRSAAIQQIALLNEDVKQLRARTVRAATFLAHANEAVSRLGAQLDSSESHVATADLVTELLDSTVQRLKDAGVDRPRLAVVKTEARRYLVIKCVGFSARDSIHAGESCPADRPLRDVVSALAPYSEQASFAMDGQGYELVLLAKSPVDRVTALYVWHLAGCLALASARDLGAASALRLDHSS
jgi:hypothetical protein